MSSLNQFEIINELDIDIPELSSVDDVLNYAIEYLKLENVIFNIIIVDNDGIHKINKEYRGVDRPTDVISFALEDDDTFIKTDFRVLGDIYISIDKAREQAISYEHSLKRELCFLAIHGLLHLLGYDHMEPEDEKEMFGLQEMILDGCGIKREKEEN